MQFRDQNKSRFESLIHWPGTIILMFLGLLFTFCEDASDNIDSANHDKMIMKMDSVIQDAKKDPLKYFYANEFRLVFLDSLVKANPGVPQLDYQYALELQNSVRIEESIPILEELLSYMRDPESQQMANEAIAISYLRLAEVNNCFENYRPVNCILPFDPEAIHRNKELIRSAINHLEILLEDYPDNGMYRWLFNISHIANGTYPEGLESEFLIPGLQDKESVPDNLDIPRFRDVSMQRGVADDRISGSACVEDFTGNGHLDIFTTSYGMGDEVILYTTDGRDEFTDITVQAGLSGIMGGLNIECADINNSGFSDVLILRGAWLAEHGTHPNSLLRNNGDGTFTDITIQAGLYEEFPTQVAGFADINQNGFLDIFIGNESASPWQSIFQDRDDQSVRFPSAIYLNNGDETFERYESLPGFELDEFVKGAVWGDINNDGFPDLFVSVMGDSNRLFVHRGLDENNLPVFEDISSNAGIELPLFSFPAFFLDYNNDGFEDILVLTYDVRAIRDITSDISSERLGLETGTEKPKLFRNMGNETFVDVTEETGLNFVAFGMGANVGDLNNSGYPDIYVGNGAPSISSIIPNRLFLNHSGNRFYEATALSGTGHLQKGHGVSFADFDQNGRMDIYAVMGGAFEGDFYHNAFFYNQTDSGNRITLQLEGTQSNRQAIGARIETVIETDTGTRSIFQTVSTGGSFGSNNSRVQIGLGEDTKVLRIIIQWPGSRNQQVIENPPVNQILKIQE